MKLNKSCSFVSKFKYLMLIPIVILLASIVIGAIFNLNYDYDFRKVNNFSVKFNTTVSESEYDKLETSLIDIIEKQGFCDYRVERIGSGAQNGLLVKIPNDDSTLNSKIEDLRVFIEENLLSSNTSISSSVVISTTDVGYSLPKNVTKMIWMSVLSIACILLFVFLYNFFRYNLASANAIVLSILLEIAMLTSSMILFRIPFNYYFVVPYVVMILTTIINTVYINNYVKSTLTLETYNKTTNSARIEEAVSKTFKVISIYNITLFAIVLAVMFFGGYSLIYLGIAILVSILISMFVSLIFNTSLWSFWYKKDRDAVLKRRINAENIKREKKEKNGKQTEVDDKIVV